MSSSQYNAEIWQCMMNEGLSNHEVIACYKQDTMAIPFEFSKSECVTNHEMHDLPDAEWVMPAWQLYFCLITQLAIKNLQTDIPSQNLQIGKKSPDKISPT